MTEKKSILLLASTAVLTLALHEAALSAPPADEAIPSTTTRTATVEPTTPAGAESPAPEPAVASDQDQAPESSAPSTAIPPPELPSPEAVPTEVIGAPPAFPPFAMPEPPVAPQIPMAGTGSAESADMTAAERSAMREQRFQRMRERFMQRRQEIAARWDSYWKTLDAMTPEQKEAIEAVFGQGRTRCLPQDMGRQMPRMPMQPPPFGQPDYGFPSGSAFPGTTQGYGPRTTEPYPFERGMVAPWLGEQPMHPGGAQPWLGQDQGGFQGPPPPGGNYPEP